MTNKTIVGLQNVRDGTSVTLTGFTSEPIIIIIILHWQNQSVKKINRFNMFDFSNL